MAPPLKPPPIDSRSAEVIAAQTTRLLQRYSEWQPSGTDPGQALVGIFSRLVSICVDRLNRVPDKSFLTFLNLLGLERLRPQAARAPLTFHLAPGSPSDAVVPARTQVAATLLAGETDQIVFETQRELVVTRSQLQAVFVREPSSDRYADHTAATTAALEPPRGIFQGTSPTEHSLYIGDSVLSLDLPKDVVLTIQPAASAAWLRRVDWSYFDGSQWRSLPSSIRTPASGPSDVTLLSVPVVPQSMRGEISSAWLRGRLTTSLPRGDFSVDPSSRLTTLKRRAVLPEALQSADDLLAPTQPVYPFGHQVPRAPLYIKCSEVFSKPEAQISINVGLDQSAPAQASTNPALRLDWAYWNGAAWVVLGQSWSVALTPQSAYGFVDGTRAFTQDGTISFRCPPDWAPGTGNEGPLDVSGYWLRIGIGQGNYGQVPTYAPPALQRLALDYDWQLPAANSVGLHVHVAPPPRPPDLAFAGQAQVDLSKDVLPFGPQPAVNDAFYVASEEAFSRVGATVTLSVVPTNTDPNGLPPPAKPNAVRLAWEYWSAKDLGWRPLPATDNTAALSERGTVVFVVPSDVGQPEISGQARHWIRVRLASGNYDDVSAHYAQATGPDGKGLVYPNGAPVYVPVAATYRPPWIASLIVAYEYNSQTTTPEHLLTENDFQLATLRPTPPVQPFQPSTDVVPALYLGFVRPGDTVGFANDAVSIYFGMADALYGESAVTHADLSVAPLVGWEYWNGRGWTRLDTEDETGGFQRRGVVTFLGPSDLLASTDFGMEAFWLRAKWVGGQYTTPPRYGRLALNTTWALDTLTTDNEVLGSSTGEPNQMFQTARAPVLAGQRIEIREKELPSAMELQTILAEEGADAVQPATAEPGQPAQIWVRWHEVADFLSSGPRDRHYTLDAATGEIRFGDDHRGMVPPADDANVRADWYQSGGGSRGNRPAGNLNQLKTTVPYVDAVVNYEAADGGADLEDIDALKIRGPAYLRHADRAVTLVDIEDLATQCSTEVARVKAIPAESRQDAGTIGLIVLPRDTSARPVPSLELLGRVQDYVSARLPVTADLYVEGPAWLKVSVRAQVVPVAAEEASNVQTRVLRQLTAFLNPLTGGVDGDGWSFGRRPHRSELFRLIEATQDVDHVSELSVQEESDSPDGPGVWFLVYSGDHEVVMVGEVGV